MEPILSAVGLQKRFGELVAVSGVSFEIGRGETYGLLGPNGAGKTTSISMIAGLLEPDSGRVTVDGEVVTTRSVGPKRAIGLVPQDLAVYPDLTARENLRFFGRLYGMERGDLGARVDEVLEVIGLQDRADDRAKEYSGGMKRLLNIGIGLLHRPRLLILDEPTVGVDPQSRNAILESVEQLSEQGMAVLYTTHYMEEAERLCDRVGIIDQGRLMAEGTRRQLVEMVGHKDRIRVNAVGALGVVADRLHGVDGIHQATVGDGVMELLVTDAGLVLAPVMAEMARAEVSVSAVTIDEPDLEAVFLHLTGKALRD